MAKVHQLTIVCMVVLSTFASVRLVYGDTDGVDLNTHAPNTQLRFTNLPNDCNSNGIPDESELDGNDCNTNGVPDDCDLTPPMQDAKLKADDVLTDNAFGNDVAISGGIGVVGAPFDDDIADDGGAVYIFREAQGVWALETKLASEDILPGDWFGSSVALDGEVLAVGASRHDMGAIDGGALFIYDVETSGWQLVAQLAASDVQPDDEFGHSIAFAGDTMVVGAHQKLEGFVGIGAAYIFRKVSGSWEEVAKLTPSDAPMGRLFGESVALDGDIIAIGATADDAVGTSSGAVYVFEETEGVWLQVAKLTARDARAFDQFGKSVAIEGDVILVGAYGDDDFGESSGAVYVFRRQFGAWQQVAKLSAGDLGAGARFGWRVALDNARAYVSAHGVGDGAVRVYEESGTTWRLTSRLSASDNAVVTGFGKSLAIAGSVGIVGATFTLPPDEALGAAYVFDVDHTSSDCNNNGVIDTCELAAGSGNDCNANGILDTCESGFDCNANGMPDECDLASGASKDCNTNGYPDVCDVHDGLVDDFNGNLVPDSCDLAGGTADDCNSNGVIDAYDLIRESRFILGPTSVFNNNAGSDQYDDRWPSIATDGQGNWIAVWSSSDSLGNTIGTDEDLLVSRSTDDGATWSNPVPLNSGAATDTRNDGWPQIVTDGRGTWLVTWWLYRESAGGLSFDDPILVSRSTDVGLTWSASVAMQVSPGEPDYYAWTWPQVATDGKGRWGLVWSSSPNINGLGYDLDIFISFSDDDGVTWSVGQPVNSTAPGEGNDDYWPSIASDGNGNWIVTWTTLPAPGGYENDILFARSSDDGLTWSETALLCDYAASDSANDFDSHLATDRKGVWIVVWQSNINLNGELGYDYDILFTRSVDAGATWSAPQPLNSFATNDGDSDYSPFLASDGNGTWVAIWTSRYPLNIQDGEDNDVVWSVSFDDGQTWSVAAFIDAGAGDDAEVREDYPTIATDGQHMWIALWNSENPLIGGEAIGTDADILSAQLIAELRSPDCDANAIPDECEADFDNDGAIDACDSDVDDDGVPNENDVCNQTPIGTPISDWGAPKGDIDDDCIPTVADHEYFEICLWLSGPQQEPIFADCLGAFDFDGDDDVDLRDFAAFVRVVE